MAAITVPQPAMAVHGHKVPNWKYQMFNTRYVGEDETLDKLCSDIYAVARGAPGGRLRTLVFNCHGSLGSVRLSKKARLTKKTVATNNFSKLKPYVDHIILVACKVIGVRRGNNKDFWNDDGVNLCYVLAGQTGARVYASNELQYVDLPGRLFGGWGDIDHLEGDILCMPPTGYATWLSSNQALNLMLKAL